MLHDFGIGQEVVHYFLRPGYDLLFSAAQFGKVQLQLLVGVHRLDRLELALKSLYFVLDFQLNVTQLLIVALPEFFNKLIE